MRINRYHYNLEVDIDYQIFDNILPQDNITCHGGGKGGTVETVAAVPPPAPPAEEATMQEFTDPALDKEKKKSKTQGAKSLQIPLIGTGTDTSGVSTIGTA